jgi:TolB-like protein/DNA-binding winged helix-turn-helix (wHTH) protein/Tfp pilus assembly protein PilF
MSTPNRAADIVRFEGLEVDLRAGELLRNGEKIKLQEQPLRILRMLLERPGEVVTREEIRQKLWPTDTFVEFDHSINAAIQRLRHALGDSAEHPRYVETLARRGYRFICPVAGIPTGRDESSPSPTETAVSDRRPRRVALAAGIIVATAAAAIALNLAGLRERLFPRPAPTIRSIAVLPLENLSGDPEQEYFSDGMTDALIAELGQIGSLRVISRTSVMQYKGAKRPLPQIAKELNVDALIEGSVLRSGDRVRVTAQLIGAVPERHLWARNYERELRDVLSLQGEVARAIADEVKAKLTPDVAARLARARPVNPEAHELYLKGMNSMDRQDYDGAIEYFKQAINRDSHFARAYVGLADCYLGLADFVRVPAAEASAKAKVAARKAVELEESLDQAHVALAWAHLYADFDWAGAEREFKRALELNPNSPVAHNGYSVYLTFVGRGEEALPHAKRAQEINPLAKGWYFLLGWIHYFNRDYDKALEQYQQEPDPLWNLPFFLAWTLREKGMYQEAITEFKKAQDDPRVWGHLGNAYARAGNKAEAQKLLNKLIESSKQKLGTWEVALVYAGLGEKDRAFEWLERAYHVRDKGMLWLKVDPPLDPLRSDPRFEDLLRRMNFPE